MPVLVALLPAERLIAPVLVNVPPVTLTLPHLFVPPALLPTLNPLAPALSVPPTTLYWPLVMLALLSRPVRTVVPASVPLMTSTTPDEPVPMPTWRLLATAFGVVAAPLSCRKYICEFVPSPM